MNSLEQLKQDLKKHTPNVGVETVLKKLKKGELKKVYISDNCRDKEAVLKLAGQSGAELHETGTNNVELGTICKKPFSISALGFE